MTDFLLLLGRLNLTMGAAIIVAYLLRRPLRRVFGASIAYAIWLIVPMVGLVSSLPPPAWGIWSMHLMPLRITGISVSSTRQVIEPVGHIAARILGQSSLVHPMIAAHTVSLYEVPDYATRLFVIWCAGAVLMGLYLARLQLRFHLAARSGHAGPAVLGFFRPHIVIPERFQEHFSVKEQAAILAHERVHLVRQDARINAAAALLRCLCWFNPLIHLGVAWLRADQELACDATVIATSVPRRDYANALVKSQIMAAALPLGCNWPGYEHPLIERVALLKRKPPGTSRRIAGIGLVVLAVIFASTAAWTVEPSGATTLAVAQMKNQMAAAKYAVVAPLPNSEQVLLTHDKLTATQTEEAALPLSLPARSTENRRRAFHAAKVASRAGGPPNYLSRLPATTNLAQAPLNEGQLLAVTPSLAPNGSAIAARLVPAPPAPPPGTSSAEQTCNTGAGCTPLHGKPAQVAESKNYCTANNEGPSDPHYAQCINKYLLSHFGWQLVTMPDGSLGVWEYHNRNTPLYF